MEAAASLVDPFTARRRTGIGGSDAGAILGVSPWASALSVWEEKVGIAPPREEPTERMKWGSRLEGAILQGYEEDTGLKVRRGGRRFRRHPLYAFMVGHPDGETEDRIVEAKVAAFLDERWGPDGSSQVPLHYYAQVQHYMVLRGKVLADLVVLVGGREMRTYHIPGDPEFQAALVKDEADFWERVLQRVPPPPDGSESAAQVLRRMYPRATLDEVVGTPFIADRLEGYLRAKDHRDEAQADMDRSAQAVQAFMGAHKHLVTPGARATWADRAGSTSWKAVAADLLTALQLIASGPGTKADLSPEAAVAYALSTVQGYPALLEQHRGEPSRTFTVTPKAQEEEA